MSEKEHTIHWIYNLQTEKYESYIIDGVETIKEEMDQHEEK